MNPKVIGIAAGAGFVLSFLVGLIFRNPILAILARAFICAALCAGMSAGISVVFEKFLAEDIELDSSAGAPKTGGIVDITLDDEKLPEIQNAPKFNVSGNLKTMKEPTENNVSDSEKTNSEQSPSSSSATAPKGEISSLPENISGESSSQSDSQSSDNNSFKAMDVSSVAASSEKKNTKGIDEDVVALPDIGDLKGSSDDDSLPIAPVKDIPISEPNISSSPQSKNGATFSDGSSPSVQDAATIAQAIRTVLAHEN